MTLSIQSTTKLHNGVQMPWLGLGVFKVEEGEGLVDAIRSAVRFGYRNIDTAAIYGNEASVGEGVRRALAENGSLFDFELTAAEMSEIDSLNRNERVGPDPDNFNF